MSVEHLKEKQVVIDEIKEKLSRAQSAVVIDYMGISVAEADAMRKKLREANVDYTVYKNKLVERAIQGTDFEALKDSLSGPSAFAISYEDAVTPARVLSGIIKDYKKMEFKAGIIEGTLYDAEGVKTIAALPSREELIAKFMGSIQSPVSKMVRTFQAIVDAMPVAAAEAAPAKEETPAAPAAEEVAPVAEAAPVKEETPEAAPVEEAKAEAAEEPKA